MYREQNQGSIRRRRWMRWAITSHCANVHRIYLYNRILWFTMTIKENKSTWFYSAVLHIYWSLIKIDSNSDKRGEQMNQWMKWANCSRRAAKVIHTTLYIFCSLFLFGEFFLRQLHGMILFSHRIELRLCRITITHKYWSIFISHRISLINNSTIFRGLSTDSRPRRTGRTKTKKAHAHNIAI